MVALMDVNGAEPSVREPGDVQTVDAPVQEPVVDQRVFIHAPQYHWHQEGGVDQEAWAAIEKLHRDTYQFA